MKTFCKLLTFVFLFQLVILSISPVGAQQTSNRAGGIGIVGEQEKGTGQIGLPLSTPNAPPKVDSSASFYYQIHILGEINVAGTYRVPPSTRLAEAIQMAGGVLSRGSYRHILLRRQGSGDRTVDLFAFKQFGDLNSNPYILDNDVIYVPLKGRVVDIEGAVRRPGVYELANEKTVEDLIKMVGGLGPGVANPTPIKIIRYDHGEKKVLEVENQETERRGVIIKDADVVVVPHFLTSKKKFDYNFISLPGDNSLYYPTYESRIFVLGSVSSPGPYPFNPLYRVRQYLTVAGGTTKLAKTRKIRLVTATGRTMKITQDTEVNPGDTIVVPEKYLPPESILSLALGLTTSILGITTAVVTLTR